MANTLFEYYSKLGQSLPSVQERAPIFEKAGLGSASAYVGSEQQNIALLGKLQAPTEAPIAQIQAPVAPITSISSIPTELPKVADIPTQIATTDFQKSPQDFITQNKKLQEDYLAAQQVSQNQLDIQTQLADVQKRATELKRSAQAGVLDIEGQPIPMAFITGQSAEVEKRANLQLQVMQDEESNLLRSLGLEQDAQKARVDIAGKKLDFALQNYELLNKAQDRVNRQNEEAFTQADKLDQRAKETLNTILNTLKGVDPNTLSQQDQLAIIQAANQAPGLTPTMVFASLKAANDQKNLDNLKKATDKGDDITSEAIDAWARRINAGTDKISSVPNNLRNKVISRVRVFAQEDIQEDIQEGLNRKLKNEDLIKQLQPAYPEFSKAEIEKLVTDSTPTKVEEENKQGFFGKVGSFFGSLFR